MDDHGRRRLTRRDAEQLLRDPSSSRHALGPVLDAARSSQARSDAAREDVAAAAFVAASSAAPLPATPLPAARRTRHPVAKALAGSGLAVVLASGGVALAATGNLPDVPVLRDLPILPDQASDRATEAVGSAGSPSPSSDRTTQPAPPATAPSDDSTRPSPTPSPSASAAPAPDLNGLCNAFRAQGERLTTLTSPAFGALVAAAGGRDDVAAFCVDRIGEADDRGPAATPGKPDRTPKPDRTTAPQKPPKPVKSASPQKPPKPEPTNQPPKPDKPAEPGAPQQPQAPAVPPTDAGPPGSAPGGPGADTETSAPQGHDTR